MKKVRTILMEEFCNMCNGPRMKLPMALLALTLGILIFSVFFEGCVHLVGVYFVLGFLAGFIGTTAFLNRRGRKRE